MLPILKSNSNINLHIILIYVVAHTKALLSGRDCKLYSEDNLFELRTLHRLFRLASSWFSSVFPGDSPIPRRRPRQLPSSAQVNSAVTLLTFIPVRISTASPVIFDVFIFCQVVHTDIGILFWRRQQPYSFHQQVNSNIFGSAIAVLSSYSIIDDLQRFGGTYYTHRQAEVGSLPFWIEDSRLLRSSGNHLPDYTI
jgi:hypothetical protein